MPIFRLFVRISMCHIHFPNVRETSKYRPCDISNMVGIEYVLMWTLVLVMFECIIEMRC